MILSSKTATLADSMRSNDAESGGGLTTENDRCGGLGLTVGAGADGVAGVYLSSLPDESRFDRPFCLRDVSSLPAPGKPFKSSLVL